MDSNIFTEHNPWWRRPEFILEDNYIAELERQRYPYFHPLLHEMPLDKNSILTLRGPRRIGKTTLVKLLIKRLLLEEKVARENIFFFPCDTVRDFKELEEILVSYLHFIRPKSEKHLYLFLDEISFVREWQRVIKSLVDSGRLKNALVLITGSSVLDLRFSAERLPGRRGEIYPWDMTFLPLTFNQFVHLVKHELFFVSHQLSSPPLAHFRKLFTDYLLCGGFPVTINEYLSKGYIATELYEIFTAWIEGDLHRVGKSENTAYQIVRRLFTHLSSTVSFFKLSRESGIASHTTVEEYLDILEKMFVLFRLSYFSLEQRQVFFRKPSKFYFTDPFILNCLRAKVEGFHQNSFTHSRNYVNNDRTRPALVENVAGAFLHREFSSLYFGHGRDEKEIDFVGHREGTYSFYEVKYQEKVRPGEFAWVKKIPGESPLTVLSKSDYHEDGLTLVPAEIFLGYAGQ